MGQIQRLAHPGEGLMRLTVARPDLIPDPAAGHQPVHCGDDAVLLRVQAEVGLAERLEGDLERGRLAPVRVPVRIGAGRPGSYPLQQQTHRIAGRQTVQIRRL